MNVNVITTENFRRKAKKLIKKYHSLKSELSEFAKSLEGNPIQGVKITDDTYKIRLAVKSKGKGKSGGLRIITHVYIKTVDDETEVYLLSIYDKSDFETISDKVLRQLIEDVQENLIENEEDSVDKDDNPNSSDEENTD